MTFFKHIVTCFTAKTGAEEVQIYTWQRPNRSRHYRCDDARHGEELNSWNSGLNPEIWIIATKIRVIGTEIPPRISKQPVRG